MTPWRRLGLALLVLGGTAAGAALGLAQAQVALPRFKPSFEERANFADMSPPARRAVLRAVAEGLSSRLADEPENVEAWLRLGQARLALGERAAAIEAYERAMALRPRSPSVLRAYAASLLGDLHVESGAPRVDEAAAGIYRRLATLAPGDPEPHWYLGLAALQAGDPERAAWHWYRGLEVLDPDDPERVLFEARIERIQVESALSERYRTFAVP